MLQYLLGQAPIPPLPPQQFIRSVRPAAALVAEKRAEISRPERFTYIIKCLEVDQDRVGLSATDIAIDLGLETTVTGNDLECLRRKGQVYSVLVHERGGKKRLWYLK